MNVRLITSLFVTCLALSNSTGARQDSSNVDLRSRMTLAQLGSTFMEDSWGYVSPSQREYAILGLSQGTGFVEVTDPDNPGIVDIKLQAVNGRDIKTYQNYAYSTVDSGPTYIYDLSDIDNGNVSFVRTISAGAHNLAVDEDSGFLYLCVGGPMNIYDLSTPGNPTFVGTWPGETHDAQVVTYSSGQYAGRQIAFVFSGRTDNVVIVDVSDKTNIVKIGEVTYPGAAYTHQGWLSQDSQYLYVSDELDGIARTTIIDVSDLTNPTFVTDATFGLVATDHNLYVVGDYIFSANYSAGMRIFDASDPVNLVEVGFYDTYATNNNSGFVGAWNAYPFFPSGNVLVSDRSFGMFMLDPTEAVSPASVGTRNAGSNPLSYTADAPLINSMWTASVDLSTTGHTMAKLYAYSNPISATLGGGQELLVGGSLVFTLPITPGPTAAFNAIIPADITLAGLTLYTQALHIMGVMPFALSNSQDLTVGF